MRIRPTLDGLAVRLATEVDSEAMVRCELQCPMVLGHRRIFVDRGGNGFTPPPPTSGASSPYGQSSTWPNKRALP